MAKSYTIEIFKTRGQYQFRVVAPNGKILNHRYNTKQGAKKGIESMKKAFENFEIKEV